MSDERDGTPGRPVVVGLVLLLASCGGDDRSATPRVDPVTANGVVTSAPVSAAGLSNSVPDRTTVITDTDDQLLATTPTPGLSLHAVVSCTYDGDASPDALPYPSGGSSCVLGERLAGGEVFERGSATAELADEGRWSVHVELAAPDGVATVDELASTCFHREPPCESQQLAIVLAGVIVTAPTVVTETIGPSLRIEGSLDEADARTLALSLNAEIP